MTTEFFTSNRWEMVYKAPLSTRERFELRLLPSTSAWLAPELGRVERVERAGGGKEAAGFLQQSGERTAPGALDAA